MSTENNNLTYKIMFGILIAIVGYFCILQINKLAEIEKSIAQLQKDVAVIQTSLISRSEIKSMIRDEIKIFCNNKN